MLQLLRSLLLLTHQTTRVSHCLSLAIDSPLNQFGTPTWPDMGLRLGRFNQLLQARHRNRIAWMMKASQPDAVLLGWRQADTRQLAAQFDPVIYSAKAAAG